MTRNQLMSTHFELLILGAQEGTGLNMEWLYKDIEVIVTEQLCDKITLWFMREFREVSWIDFRFDWNDFNVVVSAGGTEVPLEINGKATTSELKAHSLQLEKMCRHMAERCKCDHVEGTYIHNNRALNKYGRDGINEMLGLVPTDISTNNRRNAIKGHGIKVKSTTNPHLTFSMGIRNGE